MRAVFLGGTGRLFAVLRNVGRTIKVIACILFVTILFGGGIGIAGSWATVRPAERAQMWTIFLLAIVYAVSAILLYGFGQLIETSQKNAETNAEILALLKENLAKAEAGKTQTSTGPVLMSSIPQHGTGDKQWKCSKCGAYNANTSPFCSECGAYK